MKKPALRMRRLILLLPEDVVRTLKARAALEGVNPRDLITAWIQSWKEGKG
jgi:hypothetical protein